MQSDSSCAPERFPLLFALFALLLGIGCGALHVLVESLEPPDPLLSALAVTAATMLMGVVRPARPWRWVLLIGVPVPLAILIASVAIPNAHFTRAAIAGSILIMLPGIAGGFGGSILRRKLSELFSEDQPGPAAKA
jgi:ABC-type Na+ efflux pump permease subunit